MRVGRIIDINYEEDIRKIYGSDADKVFRVDDLLDELLEGGVESSVLADLLEGKSIHESLKLLESLKEAL
jgi:hypothetical protein